MQSVIQKMLYNSVKVFWLDTEILLQNLDHSIQKIIRYHPEVIEIILFGSVAEGRAVPSSDVDLQLILETSNLRFMERSVAYLPCFENAGLSVDIFAYTIDEIKNKTIPIAEIAREKGRVLFKQGE